MSAVFLITEEAYSQDVSINLSPTSGFATVAISGSDFPDNSYIIIEWDGKSIPTVPRLVYIDPDWPEKPSLKNRQCRTCTKTDDLEKPKIEE